MLYNCYTPFLEYDGLFAPTSDIFSLDDEMLLTAEIIDHPKRFLRTQVVWISPAHISAHRPKGAGLTFGTGKICIQAKQLIEAELGNVLRSDRATFAL